MPNVKASNALRKRSDAAFEAFHKYYSTIWGEERWHESMFPALSQPTRYCAVVNKFGCLENKRLISQGGDVDDVEQETCIDALSHSHEGEGLSSQVEVMVRASGHAFAHPVHVASVIEQEKVLSHWLMDFASVLAACVLQVKPKDKVLDLCAAPGGKSIVLSQILFPHRRYEVSANTVAEFIPDVNSVLHANEFDRGRQKRLETNLQSYLPQQLFSEKAVQVLQLDGTSKSVLDDLPLGENGYDKVLLDAPCSSERHIVHAHLSATSAGQISEEMTNWNASHTKNLAKTQAALLMAALRAVRIGGTVLYATCSISTEENDGVIEKMLEIVHRERKKNPNFPWRFRVETDIGVNVEANALLDKLTEKTKYGRIALPDHSTGGQWGPLYFCLLQKVQRKVTPT